MIQLNMPERQYFNCVSRGDLIDNSVTTMIVVVIDNQIIRHKYWGTVSCSMWGYFKE